MEYKSISFETKVDLKFVEAKKQFPPQIQSIRAPHA